MSVAAKRILMLVGDYVEDYEVMVSYQMLLLRGHHVDFEVEAAEGTYVPANETFDNAHVDGNLVTAPAWPAHPAWIRGFLDLLGTSEY